MGQRCKHSLLHKSLLMILCLLTVLSISVAAIADTEVHPVAFRRDATPRDGLVRVYLSSLGNRTSLTITLNDAYYLNKDEASFVSGSVLSVQCNASTGKISLTTAGKTWQVGDYFTLQRSKTSSSARIAEAKADNPYPADFAIRAIGENGSYSLQVIVHVQIETYLYGVVPFEMGNAAHIEALKAQAVAARTYTVRAMESRQSREYDVVDTSSDQVYRGTPSGNENCKNAVDATRGIVLKYGDKYANTYYSSSNGGQTEAVLNVWGGKGYDYLGVKDDPFDYASAGAKTKTHTIYKDLTHASNNQQLITLLKSKAVTKLTGSGYNATSSNTRLVRLDQISFHTPKYPSPSKLYTKADFTMTVQTVNASGKSVSTSVTVTANVFSELESMLSMSLQSSQNELWSAIDNGTTFKLRAGRNGHGVGLSQYGAMEMGKQGYGFDDILGFYFPGCTNVELNFDNGILGDSGNGSTENPDDDDDSQTPPSDDSTDAQPIGYVTVLANNFINLRAQPSSSAAILGTAPEGAELAVLSVDGNWAYVRYGNLKAYALRSLLSAMYQQSGGNPAPTVPDAKEARVHIPSGSGTVNLRQSASKNARVLTTVRHGTQISVLGTSGSFTKVTYNEYTGYIMTSYLIFPTEFTPQAPAGIPLPNPNEYQTAYVTTPSGSLNLREEPSSSATVLTEIPQHSAVLAAPYSDEWYAVRYANFSGFVMKIYLTIGEPPAGSSVIIPSVSVTPEHLIVQAKVVPTNNSLNLRSGPSTSDSVICTIPRNAIVDVYANASEWAYICYKGTEGYVMNKYLRMMSTAQGTAPDHSDEQEAENDASALPETDVENLTNEAADHQNISIPQGFQSEPGMIITTILEKTEVYLEPEEKAQILFSLPQSVQCPVIAFNEEWYLIAYENQTGYVRLADVALHGEEMIAR